MRAIIMICLFSGCAALGMRGQISHGERLEQAVWIVWHDVYEREDKPPAIRLVTDLDCTDGNGFPGFRTAIGCKQGFTWSPLEVSVAFDPDGFSRGTLAHELWHARDLREGRLDPNHKGQGFKDIGDCHTVEWECGIVAKANIALEGQGL